MILEELESRGLDLRRSGDDFVLTNCPYPDHLDSNPSFSINIKTGSFICFGCGKKGSFFELLSLLDNKPIEEIIKTYNSLQKDIGFIRSLEDIILDDNKQYRFNIKSFHKVFPSVRTSSIGLSYLKQRKILKHTIIDFDIRWGTSGKYLNRVVLPVYNEKGYLIAYSGRTVLNSKPKIRREGKSSEVLFGLYNILKDRPNKGKLGYVIVVEGEFDSMYLIQNRLNAVALMGSHLHNNQRALLRKYSKCVFLSLDGDDVGLRKMKKMYSMLKNYVRTFTIKLPAGNDPNDLDKGEIDGIYKKTIRECTYRNNKG